jgi:hypothetical protein
VLRLTSEVKLHANTNLAGGIVLVNQPDGLVGCIQDHVGNESLVRTILTLEDQIITLLIEKTIHVWVLELHCEVDSLVVEYVEIDATNGLLVLVNSSHIDIEELIEAGLVLRCEELNIDRHGEFQLTS